MSASGELLPALIESSLDEGVEASFQVDGRSMLPFIRPLDTVQVRRAEGGGTRLGDVVAVRATPGGSLLVHRVVRRRGDMLVLRGDNTTLGDGEYAEADVLGVVSTVRRRGRNVWFGAGRWGALVALAVRAGLVCRLNRVVLFVSRQVTNRRQRA